MAGVSAGVSRCSGVGWSETVTGETHLRERYLRLAPGGSSDDPTAERRRASRRSWVASGKKNCLPIPITKTLSMNPRANVSTARALSLKDEGRALAALSIAGAVRAGRAIL